MRSLSGTLSAAQASAYNGGAVFPIWKIVLSRDGQATKTYTRTSDNRVLSINIDETENSQTATVLISNSDNSLTSINFEMYQGIISKGYTTSNGDEYSPIAKMKVKTQQFLSGTGTLVCQLSLIGIPNQMDEDLAEEEYLPDDTNTDTGKTIVTKICDGTLGPSGTRPYSNYTQITPIYDSDWEASTAYSIGDIVLPTTSNGFRYYCLTAGTSHSSEPSWPLSIGGLVTETGGVTWVNTATEDGVLDSYIPADYFQVNYNNSRWSKIKELLAYTGSKVRAEDDGNLHFFHPTVSGENYNAEYKWQVLGAHVFFSKELTNRFISPNKVIVKSSDDHSPPYSGSFTSTASYSLFPKTLTLTRRLASDDEGTSIATSRVESEELNAQRGAVTIPIDVGLEVWDYIKVTDSQQGDSKEGNVRRLITTMAEPTKGRTTFDMTIAFGIDTLSPIDPSKLGIDAPISLQALADALIINAAKIRELELFLAAVAGSVETLNNREHVLKWHITGQAIMPVE